MRARKFPLWSGTFVLNHPPGYLNMALLSIADEHKPWRSGQGAAPLRGRHEVQRHGHPTPGNPTTLSTDKGPNQFGPNRGRIEIQAPAINRDPCRRTRIQHHRPGYWRQQTRKNVLTLRGLLGQLEELCTDRWPKRGEERMSNPVALVGEVDIGGILPRPKAVLGCPLPKNISGDVKEGPQQPSVSVGREWPLGRDPREPARTRAPEEPKENRLGLILGMMGKEEDTPFVRQSVSKAGVSGFPRLRLTGGGYREPVHRDGNTPTPADTSDPIRMPMAFRVHAMLYMDGTQLPRGQGPGREESEQVQENQRIPATGEANPKWRRWIQRTPGTEEGRECHAHLSGQVGKPARELAFRTPGPHGPSDPPPRGEAAAPSLHGAPEPARRGDRSEFHPPPNRGGVA